MIDPDLIIANHQKAKERDAKFYAGLFLLGAVCLLIGLCGSWRFLVAGSACWLTVGLFSISHAIEYSK